MIPSGLHKLLFLFLFTGQIVFAQSPMLVRFNDLYFNSEFEKNSFTDFQNGKSDYLSLFLAVSPSSDKKLLVLANQKLQLETDKINDKKFAKLKDEKKVGKIYEYVNKDILSRYEENTLFPDILLSGNFNCLTASAFYGFVFTNLGIGFEFKESSNHVHPVAFPGTLQIKVETTDPVFGFQYFDSKLKVQFVNYLLSSKIISKEEAGSTSVDNIFNKYYFPEASIGMKELAGLQYLNDAFYNFGRDKFDNAFRQIQKAYFLYPSNRVSTVMLFLLSRCLAETEYTKVEDASFMVYASRFIGKDLDKQDFIGEYRSMTDKVLFQRSQTELYDQISDYLIDSIDVEEVRKAIEMEYYYQKGSLLLTTYHIKEALSNFEKALLIEPDNLDLQTLTVKSLAFSFASSSNQEIVSSLEKFEQQLPMMHTNESFISLQMIGYLRFGEEKFDFDQPVEGEILLKKFENLYQLHSGISIQYEKVGDAYSAAAVYYFKKNDKVTARSYLNRGLLISPENYQLMYRLKALE
jgi:tetratricopeptide (TPR) repeat protein